MTDKLKALWARVTIHWHVAAAILLAALPDILNYLGVIDLKPLLSHFMSEDKVTLIVGILPFVLAFLKPMIVVEPKE